MVPRKTDRIARQQWHRHLSILHLSYGDVLPGKHKDPEPKQKKSLSQTTTYIVEQDKPKKDRKLAGVWTHLKNMLVQMGSSSPIFGMEVKKNWVATT